MHAMGKILFEKNPPEKIFPPSAKQGRPGQPDLFCFEKRMIRLE